MFHRHAKVPLHNGCIRYSRPWFAFVYQAVPTVINVNRSTAYLCKPKSPSCPFSAASHILRVKRATGTFFNRPEGLSLGRTVGFAIATCENLLIFAGTALVGYSAARFASALAGALALATATMCQRLTQAGFGNRFDMFHVRNPSMCIGYQVDYTTNGGTLQCKRGTFGKLHPRKPSNQQ